MRRQSEEGRRALSAIWQINRDKTTENPIQKHCKCSSSRIKRDNIEDPSLWMKRRYKTNNKIYTRHRSRCVQHAQTTTEITEKYKI